MQLIPSWVSVIAVATTIAGGSFPVSASNLQPGNLVLRNDAVFFTDRDTTFKSLFDYNYTYYDYSSGHVKPLDSLLVGVLPRLGYLVNNESSGYPAAVVGDASFWDPAVYGWSPLRNFDSSVLNPVSGFAYSTSIPIRYNWTGSAGNHQTGAGIRVESIAVKSTKEYINYIITKALSQVRNDPISAGMTEHQIAEKAFTAIVDARNGYYGSNDEFLFVKAIDIDIAANADHFLQVYETALDSSLRYNPLTAFTLATVVDLGYNFCKTVVHSIGVDCLASGSAPQSPANYDMWAWAGLIAAMETRLDGQTPDAKHPIKPVFTEGKNSTFLDSVPSNIYLRFDPLAAYGFDYKMLLGGSFQSFCIPQSSIPGVKSFTLSVGSVTHNVLPDECFDFDFPVSDFRISGFSGDFIGTSDFVSRLKFSTGGITSFTMTALDSPVVNSVSEPSGVMSFAGAFFLMILNTFWGCRRRTLV